MTNAEASCDFLPGPRLSLLFSACLILHTILSSPNAALRDEISIQFEPMLDSDAANSSHPKNRGLYTSNEEDQQLFAESRKRQQSRLRTKEKLYRPSFWPHAMEIQIPTPNSTEETSSGSKLRIIKALPTRTNYAESVFVPLETFMIVDEQGSVRVPQSEDGRSYATCQFMDYQYAFYFPHLAQQLFRCWAFWREHSDKKPAFFITNDYNWKLAMDNEFNRGMVAAIQHAGVHVFNMSAASSSSSANHGSISVHSKGPLLRPSQDHFQVTSKEDMASFRKNVIKSLNMTKAIPSSSCRLPSRFPRITIVSRLSTRRIKGVKLLADKIQEMYNLTYNVPVAYFEDVPFRHQVAAMANTDILITPHGAQETAIVFMPQCGGVLELLPDEYFFPQFYGTLAATVGLDHAYLYLANNDTHRIFNMAQRDVGFLYPTFTSIHKGLDMLIERWQQCCHEHYIPEKKRKKRL